MERGRRGGTVEREWRVCEGEKGKQERARREGERKQRRGYEKGGEENPNNQIHHVSSYL